MVFEKEIQSLKDEQLNLLKKIKILEQQNKELDERITKIESNNEYQPNLTVKSGKEFTGYDNKSAIELNTSGEKEQ